MRVIQDMRQCKLRLQCSHVGFWSKEESGNSSRVAAAAAAAAACGRSPVRPRQWRATGRAAGAICAGGAAPTADGKAEEEGGAGKTSLKTK